MRLFVILGLALAVAAQGLSKEEREALRAQKAAERKANRAKNKKNKKLPARTCCEKLFFFSKWTGHHSPKYIYICKDAVDEKGSRR